MVMNDSVGLVVAGGCLYHYSVPRQGEICSTFENCGGNSCVAATVTLA